MMKGNNNASVIAIGKKKLMLLVIVGALLAYSFNLPLPNDVAEPVKTRQIMTILHLMHDAALLSERLGLASAVTTMRFFTDSSASTFRFRWQNKLNVTDTHLGGVKVRVFDPPGRKPHDGGVMFFHGGGWVFGSVETHHHVAEALAEKLQMLVIAVEYRLAPEHPYPLPLQDCMDAMLYFMRHADTEFLVDPGRIAVVGDSAGGNLAAALTLKLRERSDVPQVALQVLIYPALQMLDFTLPAYIQNDGAVYGTREALAATMLYYMGQDLTHLEEVVANNHTSPLIKQRYHHLVCTNMLPIEYTKKHTSMDMMDGNWELSKKFEPYVLDPFFMPLMAANLTGLPKSYILTAGYDVLRDDGILYAARLRRDGVEVTWEHYPRAYHGFWAFIEEPVRTDIGLESMNRLTEFVKAEL